MVVNSRELSAKDGQEVAGNFRMIPLWHAECWRRMIQPGLDVDGTGRWNVLHSFHVRTHGVSDAPLFFSSLSIVGFGNYTAVYSAKNPP